MKKRRLSKKMRFFGLASLVLTIGAILTMPLWPKISVGQAGGPGRYRLSRYYPLSEGITWNYLQTYTGGGQNYEVYCVGGTEEINGETTDKQWEFDSGELAFNSDIFYVCYAWTKEGLERYKVACSDGTYITYDPPLIQLPNSIQIGQPFSHSTTATEYNSNAEQVGSSAISVEITLVGEENVIVPAGTFTECLKLSVVETEDGEVSELTLWLAHGIGEVKSIGDEETLELISYTEHGTTYCPGS